ncbi:MAG: hypothetical protein AB8B49_07095 [Nitratireductor sp.]
MTDTKLNISQTKSAIFDLQNESRNRAMNKDTANALHGAGYGSRVSGQHLAGSGALVFEGELLEFPQWN